jgi:hypothetical protein
VVTETVARYLDEEASFALLTAEEISRMGAVFVRGDQWPGVSRATADRLPLTLACGGMEHLSSFRDLENVTELNLSL